MISKWCKEEDEILLDVYQEMRLHECIKYQKIHQFIRTKSIKQIKQRLQTLSQRVLEEYKDKTLLTNEVKEDCLVLTPKQLNLKYPWRSRQYWNCYSRYMKNKSPTTQHRQKYTEEEINCLRQGMSPEVCFNKFNTHTLKSWKIYFNKLYSRRREYHTKKRISTCERNDAKEMSFNDFHLKYPTRTYNSWKKMRLCN